MPLYSYRCENGHLFDMQVKLDLSNAPKICEFPLAEGVPCERDVERTITMPSRAFPGADSWRKR